MTVKRTTSTDRARKGALAMHAKHPKGHLTPAMLAADRANLAKARTALYQQRPNVPGGQGASETNPLNFTGKRAKLNPNRTVSAFSGKRSKLNPGGEGETLAQYQTAAVHRSLRRLSSGQFNRSSRRILGTRLIAFHQAYRPTIHKPTGRYRRTAHRRIAPTGYMTRTGWHISRAHHMKERLYIRKARLKRETHWIRRRGHLTPR